MLSNNPRKVYTTGMVAEIFSVAPRTVSKWCDSGALESYRLPNSKDRRVTREALFRFSARHGMPSPGHCVALAVGFLPRAESAARFREHHVELIHAANPFDAGSLASERRPAYAVLDAAMGRIECGQAIKWFRENMRSCKVFIVGDDSPGAARLDSLESMIDEIKA